MIVFLCLFFSSFFLTRQDLQSQMLHVTGNEFKHCNILYILCSNTGNNILCLSSNTGNTGNIISEFKHW